MSKHRGCVCEGHWQHRRKNYVVIRRLKATTIDGDEIRSKYSEVKCMQCYKKWRSKASYIPDLPDHVERKWLPFPVEEILELIRKGHIVADFKTGEIWKEKKNNRTWSGAMILLSARTNRGDRWESDRPRGDPYLFVRIGDCNKCKEIAVSKLVWMAYNDQVVPEGYDVDHIDRNKENNAVKNLRLLESSHNRSDNGRDERDEEF